MPNIKERSKFNKVVSHALNPVFLRKVPFLCHWSLTSSGKSCSSEVLAFWFDLKISTGYFRSFVGMKGTFFALFWNLRLYLIIYFDFGFVFVN